MSATEELVSWEKISSLKRSNLDSLIDQIHDYKRQIAEAQQSISQLQAKVMASLMTADVKTVGVDYLELDEKGKEFAATARVTLVPEGEIGKFDKKKAWKGLLEGGVDSGLLQRVWKKATKTKPRSAYVKVTWAKAGEGEEEDDAE